MTKDEFDKEVKQGDKEVRNWRLLNKLLPLLIVFMVLGVIFM